MAPPAVTTVAFDFGLASWNFFSARIPRFPEVVQNLTPHAQVDQEFYTHDGELIYGCFIEQGAIDLVLCSPSRDWGVICEYQRVAHQTGLARLFPVQYMEFIL